MLTMQGTGQSLEHCMVLICLSFQTLTQTQPVDNWTEPTKHLQLEEAAMALHATDSYYFVG